MSVEAVLAGEARWAVVQGDALDVLRGMPDASADAVVTDPPAGIAFMGREWDRDKGGRAQWIAWLADIMRECLRVLKPGGHALVWALPRTSHWTATAVEDAGFEVRDVVHHLFGSGFPKSHNVGGGRGTALKPAAEHWILARKPLVGTVAANVTEYGTGAINVDACRVSADGNKTFVTRTSDDRRDEYRTGGAVGAMVPTALGRWPANVVLSHLPECREVGTRRVATGIAVKRNGRSEVTPGWGNIGVAAPGTPDAGYASPDGTETVPAYECAPGCAVAALDEQSGERRPGWFASTASRGLGYMGAESATDGSPARCIGDTGGASRFFYVAKAIRAERNAGCDSLPERASGVHDDDSYRKPGERKANHTAPMPRSNHHPTVKPLALMRWLVRLVTPPGGVVVDPFNGSGSTGCACVAEGLRYVGIEREAEYVEIARARIAHHAATPPAKPRRSPRPKLVPLPPASEPRDTRQIDLFQARTA